MFPFGHGWIFSSSFSPGGKSEVLLLSPAIVKSMCHVFSLSVHNREYHLKGTSVEDASWIENLEIVQTD